jgi:TolA-binding protein
MEILTKKATQDPPPPVSVRVELPSQVSELVMAAMSRNPDGRPQSMESLEYELNKCLSGRGVAVAQILGMTTDANVVATLNPGLSVRNLDDGIVRSASRAGTHSGISELWDTRSGVSRGLGGQSSGSINLRPQSEPTPAKTPSGPSKQQSGPIAPRASSPVVLAPGSGQSAAVGEVVHDVKKRGGMAVFGWIMLVLIIVGGAGAAAYVMFLKPPDKGQPAIAPGSNDPGSAQQQQQAVPPIPVGSDEAGSDEKAEVPPPQAGSNTGSADTTPDDAGSAEEHVATPKNPKNPRAGQRPSHGGNHHTSTAAEERDPKALTKQGQALEGSGDWQGARAIYTKLEKIKGYEQFAEYRMAYDAFQSADTSAAQSYAQKAASRPGPQKYDAMVLYGDALFKNGEYKRAKDVYIGLRAKVTGDRRASATKKIALCNQKLGLAERDGVTD